MVLLRSLDALVAIGGVQDGGSLLAELVQIPSGAAFQYEFKNGNYRIFSTGIPGYGQIELGYRSPPAPSSSGAVHPSP